MPEQFILQYVNSLCDITALDLNVVRACSRMTGCLITELSCNGSLGQSKLAPIHCRSTTLHCWLARKCCKSRQRAGHCRCLAGRCHTAAIVAVSSIAPVVTKTMHYMAQAQLSFQKILRGF